MDTEQKTLDSIRKQLSGIKFLVAVGAIGFLLVGVAATVFSISIATMMGHVEEEYEGGEESTWWDKASDYFERGDREKLLGLVEERLKTHPNDAQVFWFRAKAHILGENWEAALMDVQRAQFLSPSWGRKYTIPMSEALREKLGDDR